MGESLKGVPARFWFNTGKIDGVVKTLHLLRCYKFYIITTYLSTPK